MKKLFLRPQGYKPQFGVVKNMCVQMKIMFPSSLSSYDASFLKNKVLDMVNSGPLTASSLMYSGRHVFSYCSSLETLTHSDSTSFGHG